MKLEDKLQMLRRQNGYSQEQLADKLNLARQTISKWENGQAVPELNGLIALSRLYGVTIDRLVKEDDTCNILLGKKADLNIGELTKFLVQAKRKTYAAKENSVRASRLSSHDFSYGEDDFLYYDTYIGAQKFSGEEAVWLHQIPVWSMNYSGRVTGEHFDSDFLKEALLKVPEEKPYRGPEIYTKGDYHYHCNVTGEIIWFQGYEAIYYLDQKIYECYFHGGEVI